MCAFYLDQWMLVYDVYQANVHGSDLWISWSQLE